MGTSSDTVNTYRSGGCTTPRRRWCAAHAIADGGRLVLGAQAGEGRGFTRIRRAADAPFNLILDVRR
jgi:hypothetical protein